MELGAPRLVTDAVDPCLRRSEYTFLRRIEHDKYAKGITGYESGHFDVAIRMRSSHASNLVFPCVHDITDFRFSSAVAHEHTCSINQ